MRYVWVAVPVPFDAPAVNVQLPVAAGVPVISPVPAARYSPEGRLPPGRDQVTGVAELVSSFT